MKCVKCGAEMRKKRVSIQDAANQAVSYQCPKCSYFTFDRASSAKVIDELRIKDSVLQIKQKIVKISQGRLGLYINKHVAESLKLKSGDQVLVSVPDEKHIIVKIE